MIAGGTGSGKTTFANALLHEKVAVGPPNQRFLILEGTIELQCSAPTKVQLRTCDVADLARLCARRCGCGPTRPSSVKCEGGKPVSPTALRRSPLLEVDDGHSLCELVRSRKLLDIVRELAALHGSAGVRV